MSVKLRLRRMGKKRQPVYKIVAVDARAPRDGAFLEAVGFYNPKTDPYMLEIDQEKAIKWLEFGAQPTDTVRSLLKKKGIILLQDLKKQKLPIEVIEEKMNAWRALKGMAPISMVKPVVEVVSSVSIVEEVVSIPSPEAPVAVAEEENNPS